MYPYIIVSLGCVLSLEDYHSAQLHQVEFRLFFISRMFSWIGVLNLHSVPLLCFPSFCFTALFSGTPIIHTMTLLCLSSISATFSLTFFTFLFKSFPFSSLFSCLPSGVFTTLSFKSILPLIACNLVCYF